MSACPETADEGRAEYVRSVRVLQTSNCYRQGVIYFNAQVSDRAFDLSMSKQKLNGPEVSRPPVDQGSFFASQRMGPNSLGASPALPIQSETRRAYWRVVMLVWGHDGP
jgi:hypothetical protein